MGALDGLTVSNTWAFEHALGWRGVHIEASPPSYDKLVVNRPGQLNIHVAVCDKARVSRASAVLLAFMFIRVMPVSVWPVMSIVGAAS